jgi:hypothetical protein
MALPVVEPVLRRRRVGDERAAVSVAGRHEFAGGVLAQQFEADGVDAVGDRERAAEVAGRLGVVTSW